MPTLYFTIYSLKTMTIVSFEDYLLEGDKERHKNSAFSKEYEVSKTVFVNSLIQNHPFNGTVYYFLFLCKFNAMLSEMEGGISNVLILWLSMILQIFDIPFPMEILKQL